LYTTRRRRIIPLLMEVKVNDSDMLPLRMILLVGVNAIAHTEVAY